MNPTFGSTYNKAYTKVRSVLYCLSCMGECDPDKHEDMKCIFGGIIRHSFSLDFIFRPSMILARGDLENAKLNSFCIGPTEQLAISGIPMKIFDSAFDFPVLAKLVKSGLRLDFLSTNLVFVTIPVGISVTIELSAPVIDFGLYGCTLEP